ncbi:MAG: hypothetical protein DLM55_12750 [Acidimicrobiales bacterium]|nr:MAG: hypothetical protein DLM55_12750 [Acidimicrobiales bacterium]
MFPSEPEPPQDSASEPWHELDPDEDTPFVPPEPPPMPLFAPASVLGAMATIVGLGLLFYPAVLTSFLGVSIQLSLLLAAMLLLTGVATLISRLRNPDPDEPEDPDLGAQV